MSTSVSVLQRLERDTVRLLDFLALRPGFAALVLGALALFVYLPGVIMLSPVDRTEVIYTLTSQKMLAQDTAIDASFDGEHFQFRPIGIYWFQIAAGKLLGEWSWDDVITYRLPSLLGGVLAVLALWWLSRPLIGPRRAIIAAALFAVSPIVALQATLAIPEGPLLLTIVITQLCLMRIYASEPQEDRHELWLAMAFWVAQGVSILLNALAVPILSLVTVVLLYVFDRRLAWLRCLRPLTGVLLMCAIAAPWLLIRAHFDGGVPFAGMSWDKFIRALGGAQNMKWHAAPLTFTLAILLGTLPAAIFLFPALRNLWQTRSLAIERFLFAWIVGYWLYLELIASKPALYTVQAIFPAIALAIALVIDPTRSSSQAQAKTGHGLIVPPQTLRMPWWLVAIGLSGIYIGGLWLAGAVFDWTIALVIAVVVAMLTLSAAAILRNYATAWFAAAVSGFALFIPSTFALVMPHMEIGWPAQRMEEALAPLRRCVSGPVGVIGFREPSATFAFGRTAYSNIPAVADWMAAGDNAIALVDDRWQPDLDEALAARKTSKPQRLGCIETFNVMRGCPLHFSIYAAGREKLDPECQLSEEYACTRSLPAQADPDSRCR
ncbi:hypothetical protein APY04_0913 [Hyphomicrobium sulfonivorans]|uniref:Glycosyltransferase RgtA/B/C/D-like domain-containing protein n=1 Tax=Hyphomicrobium sulfonivorans TaxID=121290 RepID=A0A120CX99_HYPSL|nr:glycosyltransferase family 39 protein [Hyphomicrobium sulfonivorans]KWT70633.1 hypothetical protein APY04_0913 [Hyphomicrobium sulfonivorans]